MQRPDRPSAAVSHTNEKIAVITCQLCDFDSTAPTQLRRMLLVQQTSSFFFSHSIDQRNFLIEGEGQRITFESLSCGEI